MALACTQAEYDALADAIKSGVLRVAYADKMVTYQSLRDMRAVLTDMGDYLAGSAAPARHSRAAFKRD